MCQRGVCLLEYTVLKGGDGYTQTDREAVEKSIGVT